MQLPKSEDMQKLYSSCLDYRDWVDRIASENNCSIDAVLSQPKAGRMFLYYADKEFEQYVKRNQHAYGTDLETELDSRITAGVYEQYLDRHYLVPMPDILFWR